MEITTETLDEELRRILKAAGATDVSVEIVLHVTATVPSREHREKIYLAEMEIGKQHLTTNFDFRCLTTT